MNYVVKLSSFLRRGFIVVLLGLLATTTPVSAGESSWNLMLSHDRTGKVREGNHTKIVNAVRSGCQVRIAWGGVSQGPPQRSIEHVADIKWISVRNDGQVSAQIGDFLINLVALGEPAEDHLRREQFGGTDQVVKWRATLHTDGRFDAVWFVPHSGVFVTRRPQQYPMKWFADCEPDESAEPLYMIAND